ncbi:hypothetical protein HNQ91_000143 [Filimonas zeae]|nr:SMI1/KNR4 family protein [Filimonas zeae]MDR6337121.1 hypothetical protein [Filimonas zeae]
MKNGNYRYMGFLQEYKSFKGLRESATEAQIAALEAQLKVKFPAAYREIFQILGRQFAFDIGQENSFVDPDYKGMLMKAKEIAAACADTIDVGGKDFVFCCFLETEYIWFFKTDEGDNPPVYAYEKGGDTYEKVADSLVSFVKNVSWYQGYLLLKERRSRMGRG